MGQSGTDPLPQDLPFKLGENGQQAGHGASGWGGQVQGFGQGNKTDAQMLQFLECGEQIRYRPAPAVQPPNQHDIDLAAACGLQQFLTSLSPRRTGTDLTNLHGDRPAAPGSILPHGATLHGQCLLIVRGNAGVQASAKHFRRLPCLAKNVVGFCLRKGLFGGHFRTSPNHGRSRSFPARRGTSHPTRNRAAPASHDSSRASIPLGCASLPRRAAATR